MFYRHKDLQEGFVHQCSDAHKYNKEHKKEIARIRKHDTSIFLVVGLHLNRIKYCPYCGVELAKDEETQEFLNLKL